jgi:hypothetical protein
MSSAGTFVVGTGRCGSTLVSNLLREHPDVASVSEFFSFVSDLGCRLAQTFPEGPVDGPTLWAMISTPWPRQSLMLRHDVAMDEVLYPWKGGGRFDASTGVPAVSQATLPHLSASPDALFDALREAVLAFEPAPIGTQYARLFGWLARRFDRSCWVERSGGGLRVVRRMRQHFPGARFVHIVRDGRDTALSMSRHPGFRMVFAAFQMLEGLGVDPFESADRRWESDLGDDVAALLPERFSRAAFLEFETPPPLCGHYWSGEVKEGLEALADLGPDRLLTLRYEDFLVAPAETSGRLIAFIRGEVDEAWVGRVTAMVRAPRSAWQALEPRERSRLDAACAPGFAALAAQGLRWPET